MNEYRKLTKAYTKLLKKLFGYRNMREAVYDYKRIKTYIEGVVNKSIEDITDDDIRLCPIYCARYKTLHKIIESYLMVTETRFD